MIKVDEHALICDLAETYQIYDYRIMPPSRVAIFAVGLRESSRIKMKLAGLKVDVQTILQAATVDRLSTLVWQQSADGQKNKNRPKSILETMLNQETESEISTFTTGEEFEEERKRILAEGGIEWQQN